MTTKEGAESIYEELSKSDNTFNYLCNDIKKAKSNFNLDNTCRGMIYTALNGIKPGQKSLEKTQDVKKTVVSNLFILDCIFKIIVKFDRYISKQPIVTDDTGNGYIESSGYAESRNAFSVDFKNTSTDQECGFRVNFNQDLEDCIDSAGNPIFQNRLIKVTLLDNLGDVVSERRVPILNLVDFVKDWISKNK